MLQSMGSKESDTTEQLNGAETNFARNIEKAWLSGKKEVVSFYLP